MKALSLGMPLLVLDLLFGMLFLLLILMTAQPLPPPPEPPEAESRRLRAENTELSARLLTQEGAHPGESREAPSRGDGSKSPHAAPSQAAEASSLTLLRAEVAELNARNETLRRALATREAGKRGVEDRTRGAAPSEPGRDEQTVDHKESLLAGREARIKQLQTEVFRLFTLVEESSREAGEARQARVTLEARLKQREARLSELNQEIEALSARTPGLAQTQATFSPSASPAEPATAPTPESLLPPPPKPGGNPSTDSSRPPARRFDRSAPRPPVTNQP